MKQILIKFFLQNSVYALGPCIAEIRHDCKNELTEYFIKKKKLEGALSDGSFCPSLTSLPSQKF